MYTQEVVDQLKKNAKELRIALENFDKAIVDDCMIDYFVDDNPLGYALPEIINDLYELLDNIED